MINFGQTASFCFQLIAVLSKRIFSGFIEKL